MLARLSIVSETILEINTDAYLVIHGHAFYSDSSFKSLNISDYKKESLEFNGGSKRQNNAAFPVKCKL